MSILFNQYQGQYVDFIDKEWYDIETFELIAHPAIGILQSDLFLFTSSRLSLLPAPPPPH
jgi:hypothetical protein